MSDPARRPSPAFRPGPGLRAAVALRQVGLVLVLPLLLAGLWWRGRRLPLYRRHMAQRFGGGMLPAAAGCVWMLAERPDDLRLVLPVLRGLLDRGVPVVLSHAAPEALAEGQRIFAAEMAAGRMRQGHAPLALAPLLRRLLRRHRPRLVLLAGAQVPPVLVLTVARAGLPLVRLTGDALAAPPPPGLAAVLPVMPGDTVAALSPWLGR